MFSERLEKLIKVALKDGVLSEQEKVAIIKRAEEEGEDINEVEIYIQSLLFDMQQDLNNKAKIASEERALAEKKAQEAEIEAEIAEEKRRRGNVCPHCGTPIPPLTKICPNCGKAITGNESVGDIELLSFIEQMEKRLVEVKSGDLTLYNKNKAELEADIRKAKTLYGTNNQVKYIVGELESEMAIVDATLKRQKRNKLFIRFALLLLLFAFCLGGYSLYTSHKKKAEAEAFAKSPIHLIDVQCDSLCALINALEEPNQDNYAIQKDKFLKISWTTINANWSDKETLRHERNKKEKFYDCVRNYARKLVSVYQLSHHITNPHKAYDPEFSDIKEYDGLYGYYNYGFLY